MDWENLKINWPDNNEKMIERKKPAENPIETGRDFIDEEDEEKDPIKKNLDYERQIEEADKILKEKNKILLPDSEKGRAGLEGFKVDSDLYYHRLENERRKRKKKLRQQSRRLRQTTVKKSSPKPLPADYPPKNKLAEDSKTKNWQELMEKIYGGDKDVMSDIDPSRRYKRDKK